MPRNPFTGLAGLLRRPEPQIAPVIPLQRTDGRPTSHRRTTAPTSHRRSRRNVHACPPWQIAAPPRYLPGSVDDTAVFSPFGPSDDDRGGAA